MKVKYVTCESCMKRVHVDNVRVYDGSNYCEHCLTDDNYSFHKDSKFMRMNHDNTKTN